MTSTASRVAFPALLAVLVAWLPACVSPDTPAGGAYDLILQGGTVYDGSGETPYLADIGIRGDTLAAIGDLSEAEASETLDAAGLAIAPGFINMMSWSNESLIEDGRSQGDIRQGITLEVMGEGSSMGPLSDDMKRRMAEHQGDIQYEVAWTTLDEYLRFLETRGVSTNVASFIGAETPRAHVIGYDDRPATPEELDQMRGLVRQAMEEGAMGVASSLIYPPGSFAGTDELVALAKVAAEYDGLYASHLRNEGNGLLEALDELITVARQADIRAEVYHLKAAGRSNWGLFDTAVSRIEEARQEGLAVTADVYTYPASGTGLNVIMPPWVQEGGFAASLQRLQDEPTRQRIAAEMLEESDAWENMWLGSGSADKILLVGFKTEALKPLTGKTLAEVAEMRGGDPRFVAMDLIVEDESRIGTIYFSQSPENLRKKVALPWVSFCTDASSMATEGVFLESGAHPRAYGSLIRVLGLFTRDEGLLSLQEAVRKLAALPAENLKLDRRGRLEEGWYADVVVFDPAAVQDHATFEEPHQYSTGMVHVLVNGVPVLRDGEHTGTTPGRVVRGPGWKGRPDSASE